MSQDPFETALDMDSHHDGQIEPWPCNLPYRQDGKAKRKPPTQTYLPPCSGQRAHSASAGESVEGGVTPERTCLRPSPTLYGRPLHRHCFEAHRGGPQSFPYDPSGVVGLCVSVV
ncbi:unnamed protein product [Gadus morhua 'NCC']